MPADANFEALEKQLAKDALEKALKDLHGEITREIERNKKDFSHEIKTSLSHLTETLENHISKEIDRKLPLLLEKNFSHTSQQVKENFEQMFLPILYQTEEDMEKLHTQGENTLRSWENMMKQYTSFWTKPFCLVLATSILTGVLISLFSWAFIGTTERRARQSCEDNLKWYATKYFEMKEAQANASSLKKDSSSEQKPKNKGKKKQKIISKIIEKALPFPE